MAGSDNSCDQLFKVPAIGISNPINKQSWGSRYSAMGATFDILIDALKMHMLIHILQKLGDIES